MDKLVTIRQACVADAEPMGDMLVPTWLAAHKGQMPEHLWEKRQREWTPAVSARGWRETLEEMAEEGTNGRLTKKAPLSPKPFINYLRTFLREIGD